MKINDKFFTPDEFARQLHKILKELYPSIEASGDDVRQYLIVDAANETTFRFQAYKFAGQFRMKSELLIEKIYSELLIEYEKNWHDRIFFKILRNDKSISIEVAGKEGL